MYLFVFLSLSLCVCLLSICLSDSLSVCVFYYLSICFCLSVCLLFSLSVCLHIYLCVCLSVILSISVCIYIYVSVSVILYICLSVYLCICLSFFSVFAFPVSAIYPLPIMPPTSSFQNVQHMFFQTFPAILSLPFRSFSGFSHKSHSCLFLHLSRHPSITACHSKARTGVAIAAVAMATVTRDSFPTNGSRYPWVQRVSL